MLGGLTTAKGWTEEYVLNMPLARAFLLWTEYNISEGGAQWAEPSYEERDKLEDYAEAVKSLSSPG